MPCAVVPRCRVQRRGAENAENLFLSALGVSVVRLLFAYWLRLPVGWPAGCAGDSLYMRSFLKSAVFDSPESGPRDKASGRSRWVFASMATLPTPFAAYSKGPGLAELLRLYVCGLQPRPSAQLSSSTVIANDNEHSRENYLKRTSQSSSSLPDRLALHA